MTTLQFLEATTGYLARHGVESPRLTAELLLAEAWKKKRLQLYLEFSAEVPPAVLDELRPLVKRRALGEPLQYVQGYAEFNGERFRVTPDVLIPRPETELLLAAILPLLGPSEDGAIADIGTGSGILAKGVARARPDLIVHAVDVSAEALAIAASNFSGLVNIRPVHGHLLGPLDGVSFQMILANLPYVPSSEIASLTREVRHEPGLALDGGDDGLAVIRELIAATPGRTRFLALEIGKGQAGEVKNLLLGHGYDVAQVITDYSEIERIIIGKYRG